VSSDWRTLAACRGKDRSLFFPGTGESNKVRAAKAICAACPVKAECRAYAIRVEAVGVWGEMFFSHRVQAGPS
jgi:WhiB family redox-sensing transcriptional regulator